MAVTAIAKEISGRLKQERLNRNLSQSEVAALARVSRKTVLSLGKGKVQIDMMIAIMSALDLTERAGKNSV